MSKSKTYMYIVHIYYFSNFNLNYQYFEPRVLKAKKQPINLTNQWVKSGKTTLFISYSEKKHTQNEFQFLLLSNNFT